MQFLFKVFIVLAVVLLGSKFGAVSYGKDLATINRYDLIWQSEPENFTFTWTKANEYCRSLTFGDFHNWRLPYRKELLLLVELSSSQTEIHNRPKTGHQSFWSATVHDSKSFKAWYVDFRSRKIDSAMKIVNLNVLCVHDNI